MAIEKLQHWYNTWDRSSSWPSGTDIINKINEIIDYLTSQPTTLATKVDLAGVKLITNSGKVEQEPNGWELVLLDVQRCYLDIAQALLQAGTRLDSTEENAILSILSKYWVSTPKKFRVSNIDNRFENQKTHICENYIVESNAIQYFLKDHNMLEE